jgi:hypothetical protein
VAHEPKPQCHVHPQGWHGTLQAITTNTVQHLHRTHGITYSFIQACFSCLISNLLKDTIRFAHEFEAHWEGFPQLPAEHVATTVPFVDFTLLRRYFQKHALCCTCHIMSLCNFGFEFTLSVCIRFSSYHSDFAAVGMQGPCVKEHMIPSKHMISGRICDMFTTSFGCSLNS